MMSRADLVVPSLRSLHALRPFGVDGALLLEGRLAAALIGQCRLHRDIALTQGVVLDLCAAVQVAHLQGQKFRQGPSAPGP
ncbi:MAG: hypothetical protein WDM77_20000 [Steroidobacteraceae bacterium]